MALPASLPAPAPWGRFAFAVVGVLLMAGCVIRTTESRAVIKVEGVEYEVRVTLELGPGDGAWAAIVNVPGNGSMVVADLDAPLLPGPDGAMLFGVLHDKRLIASGDLFRCSIDFLISGPDARGGPPSRFQYVATDNLPPGTSVLLLAWKGVTGNASVRVAVAPDVALTDLGQSSGAVGFQPATMGDSMPALRSGTFNQHLSGPTMFWSDFAVDARSSGDVTVTAAGATHSGHVAPGMFPTVTSYAGIWNSTDFSVSYDLTDANPDSGLYGALVTLPERTPTPGWLEAQHGQCAAD